MIPGLTPALHQEKMCRIARYGFGHEFKVLLVDRRERARNILSRLRPAIHLVSGCYGLAVWDGRPEVDELARHRNRDLLAALVRQSPLDAAWSL